MSARPGSVTRRGDQLPVRRRKRRAGLVNRTRPVRLRRRAPFHPFIVQETGREPAKLEIEVQVLVKGPLFSSRGEITIMRRFERCVAGGSPAVRSNYSAWPRSSGLRLLSGSTQVQFLPRGLWVVAGSRFPNGLENRGAMLNRNGATPSTTATGS